ncbi:MAG: hypothetical protein HY841_14325 [Bacteroidetes bacterium]|nr:hypothetical protein [Bacteroidota bacterium]
MKKKIIIIGLIVVVIALGFLRDYLFVSMNHIIESGGDVHGNLSMQKWILTFVFSLLYLGICCTVLYLIFYSFKYVLLAFAAYSLLFLVSFFVALAGYFISSFESVYPFIRTVMGIAQSPVVLIVLIPACFLNELKIRSKKT